MQRRVSSIIALGFLGLYSVVSQAFTYVPMTDEALLAQSPVVVLGQVLSVDDGLVTNRRETEYQISVQQVIKGDVPVNTITVQTPGSRQPSMQSHWLPGLPSMSEGEAMLLFLQPHDDGRYGLMQLGLGAFKLQRDAQGNSVFARELANTERLEVSAPLANAVTELPRDAAAFLTQLGGQPEFEQLLSDSGRQTANFTTMGVPQARWYEFDAGQDVPFRAHSGGQPEMNGGGFTEIRNAINAWNNDPGSNIRYRYAGTSSRTAGFAQNDGVNVVLFDDPNGEVDGSFDCQTGGVLAAGGFVSSVSTQPYNGQLFAEIREADIITNDGAGCFFSGFSGKLGEQIFGHELGHTLGLGHSCGDDELLVVTDCDLASADEFNALMRAYPHVDDRGAQLSPDDRAGAAFLYGMGNEQPTDDGAGGDDGVVRQDDPDSGGGGGGNKSGGGGGGGGCAMSTGGPVDPLLWLFTALSLVYLLRRRRQV